MRQERGATGSGRRHKGTGKGRGRISKNMALENAIRKPKEAGISLLHLLQMRKLSSFQFPVLGSIPKQKLASTKYLTEQPWP